jgi:hypothetical protein
VLLSYGVEQTVQATNEGLQWHRPPAGSKRPQTIAVFAMGLLFVFLVLVGGRARVQPVLTQRRNIGRRQRLHRVCICCFPLCFWPFR